MASRDSLEYLAFGISIALAIYLFVMTDHLWKKNFFQRSLIFAGGLCLAGAVLDLFRLVDADPGLASIVMSAPLIYLGYFWLFRFFYKRKYSTEPYATSASSSIGDMPLDMFSSALKDGKKRKYAKDRRINAGDFAFTFLLVLVPVFTIMGL